MSASYWDALKARRAQASPAPAVHSTMPTLSIECPCGRARAGCEYHDPALQQLVAAADATPTPCELGCDAQCVVKYPQFHGLTVVQAKAGFVRVQPWVRP